MEKRNWEESREGNCDQDVKLNKKQTNNLKEDQYILDARTARCLEGQFIFSVTFLTGY